MPVLSVWAIRASLVHLFIGFTLGGLLLANKGLPIHPAIWALLPAHIELLLLGWMAQLAMGVAYWILPRFAGERGNVHLARTAFLLLNLGVLSTGLAPALRAPGWVTLTGQLFVAGAVATFTAHAWPRVKPPGA